MTENYDDAKEGKEGKSSNRVLRRLILVFIPIVAVLIFIIALFLILEGAVFNIMMGAMIGYTISPFGPELVIPAGVGFLYEVNASSLTFLLVFAVVFVDVILALFVLLNFELVEGIPLVGRWIKKSKEIFAKKLKKGKEKLALSALALYVALPFQGSGGFVGSIMGRVVGLNRYRVFLAVAVGSILGAVPIGIAAYYGLGAIIGALEAGENFYKIIGILIIIIFIIVVVYIIRKETIKRRAEKRRKNNERT